MKVISIIQPWATLIALGEKKFETRSWATKHRGEIAIHSSKKIDKQACREETIKSVLEKHGYTEHNLPTGVILAKVKLSDCWSIGEDWQSGMPVLFGGQGRAQQISLKETHFGWYEPGRYAWELSDVEMVEHIPAKGQLGLWNFNIKGAI